MDQFLSKCKEGFVEKFGKSNSELICSAAPGRVNLIGEHTDYNEGFVFPMCLPLNTVCVGRSNESGLINVYSKTLDKISSFSASTPVEKSTEDEWSNYIRGVFYLFQKEMKIIYSGLDLYIDTQVPLGGGLSSSASLEVAVATFLETKFNKNLEKRKKALLCQAAEHQFASVPCGIMDQWISVHGKKGHALVLDCRTCTHQYVPMNDPNYVILVTNSNVKHSLGGSDEYSLRRASCYSVSGKLGKKSLRDVTMAELQENRAKFTEIEFKRAHHVIGENDRVESACSALKSGDIELFGRLMNESHNSLRDDYHVSCAELDQLVDIARSCPGVKGSRMTGGGFGGCTVTLVNKANLDQLKNQINKEYNGNASFITASAADGARII